LEAVRELTFSTQRLVRVDHIQVRTFDQHWEVSGSRSNVDFEGDREND
jgi:hypothetical protein